MTREGVVGIVVVSLGLAALGFWRASSATGDEHAARRAAPAAELPEEPDQEPVVAPPSPPRAVVVAPPAAPVAAPMPAATPDEASLMERLRAVKETDAALAVTLAREGNRRFPQGDGAPERASILIHALARQGLSSEARGEAEDMVNRYPDSDWVREVERFTGAHRHRNLRLNARGEIESY